MRRAIAAFLIILLATLPVWAVSYLGYNTVGGTMTVALSNDLRAVGPFTAPANGTATRVEVYTNQLGNQCTVGIYSDSAGTVNTLLAESAGGLLNGGSATEDWRGQDLVSTYNFSGGDKLYAAAFCNGSQDIFYDVVSPGEYFNTSVTYAGGAMPSPFPSPTFNGATISFRIAYNSSGVPSTTSGFLTQQVAP
jgi:hypothetical protein